jgi:hypothetical protein
MSMTFGRAALCLALIWAAADAVAQPLGSFSWQQLPYCNVLTVNVTQSGAVYTLDGYDSQCGAGERAAAVGMAFINPNGTVGLGFTIVNAPGGMPVHIDATISLATLSGTWRDNGGSTGSFVFTPGAAAPGRHRGWHHHHRQTGARCRGHDEDSRRHDCGR